VITFDRGLARQGEPRVDAYRRRRSSRRWRPDHPTSSRPAVCSRSGSAGGRAGGCRDVGGKGPGRATRGRRLHVRVASRRRTWPVRQWRSSAELGQRRRLNHDDMVVVRVALPEHRPGRPVCASAADGCRMGGRTGQRLVDQFVDRDQRVLGLLSPKRGKLALVAKALSGLDEPEQGAARWPACCSGSPRRDRGRRLIEGAQNPGPGRVVGRQSSDSSPVKAGGPTGRRMALVMAARAGDEHAFERLVSVARPALPASRRVVALRGVGGCSSAIEDGFGHPVRLLQRDEVSGAVKQGPVGRGGERRRSWSLARGW
jgi:hypothetical protein